MRIEQVLMDRDGMSEKEAKEAVASARGELLDRLSKGDMPFDFCEEMFGLEPDYLEDLI